MKPIIKKGTMVMIMPEVCTEFSISPGYSYIVTEINESDMFFPVRISSIRFPLGHMKFSKSDLIVEN